MSRSLKIGLILIAVSQVFLWYLALNESFGEKYIPNLTKSEIEEFNIVNLCYGMDGNLTIQTLEEFCNMTYGGIDTTYGDKIK